jgi:pyrroline-5-carboxylate reductase
MNEAVGIIGLGRMGGALLHGLIAAGHDPRRLHVATLEPERLAAAAELGVWTHDDNRALAKATDTVVLAVKPKDVPLVLPDLADLSEGALCISVAAGIRSRSLAAGLPLHAAVVRAMPNTACLVRAGVTVLFAGPGATEAHAARAETLFSAVGETERVADESLLDAVTALSASGPAFLFTAIEALADGGVLLGLPRDQALRLAVHAVRGAAELCRQRGEHPARLREEVASPAGTTIHGLRALEEKGFRAALIAAVEAAGLRAAELGDQSSSGRSP